jgi:hypothetical protein
MYLCSSGAAHPVLPCRMRTWHEATPSSFCGFFLLCAFFLLCGFLLGWAS